MLDYYNHQWEKHRLLVGESSLAFTKSLSEPLQSEISLFMVRTGRRSLLLARHMLALENGGEKHQHDYHHGASARTRRYRGAAGVAIGGKPISRGNKQVSRQTV